MVDFFSNSKQKGIYLPLSDNDEEDLKKNSEKSSKRLRRPHLLMLTIMLLGTVLLGISFFVYNSAKVSSETFAISSKAKPLPLMLISIDGFRYDYLKRAAVVPNLRKLCKGGIHGPMKPQFPSYTFPNHFSLVTGLYPESHGIVGNSFYDPALDEYFSYNEQEDLKESKWWQAEPIWNAVQRFGMKSATMFWPGSESLILGARPNYYEAYDGSVTTSERVDQVLKWLDLPDSERPSFISLYLSLVDEAGHLHGPDSEEVNVALKEADSGIERLILGLKERGMNDSINLLIVSDHGMADIPDDERFHVYLDELIPRMKERLQWVDYGPMASLIPLEGEDDSIYSELKGAQMRGVHFMVYRREELPLEYHYQFNGRIAPIVLIAKKGYIIDFRGGNWVPRGAHGYDPSIPEMQALLIATGPQFRDAKHSAGRRINRAVKGVSNLDVYPLMMNLLNIPPAPNNGTMNLVNMIK